MSELGDLVRARTDALDSAGNTTAAIGKGFAIGSAFLVAMALFGAFVTEAGIKSEKLNIMDELILSCFLFGSTLPYWFSAMTMRSVGKAAMDMVAEVRR